MSTMARWEILVETAVQREVIAALAGEWGIVRERPRIGRRKMQETRQSLDGQTIYYPGGRLGGKRLAMQEVPDPFPCITAKVYPNGKPEEKKHDG